MAACQSTTNNNNKVVKPEKLKTIQFVTPTISHVSKNRDIFLMFSTQKDKHFRGGKFVRKFVCLKQISL